MPKEPRKNSRKTKPHEPYAGDTQDRPHIKSATEIQQAMRDNQIPDGDNTTALGEKTQAESKEKPAEKPEIKIPALIQEDARIRYEFSDAERLALGSNLAQGNSQIHNLKEELKSLGAEYKSKIKSLETAIGSATEKINSGFEMRTVQCNVLHKKDCKPPLKCYYRTDTGTYVKQEVMNAADLSMLSQPWPKGHEIEDPWLPEPPKAEKK